MIKLSVAIITFNEERNIGRCLDSVKDIADDIVVVDSISSDRTVEIAKEKGARIVLQKFLGHIQQKNFAITQAKYPHVLSLDADEALSEELKQSILEVKKNWVADGYIMNRLTNYCGKWIKHGSWYPDRKLRLWDSRKGNWGGINPHDKYEMDESSKIERLKGDILHYSYYSISEHIQQIDKFTSILAKEYFEKERKAGFVKLYLSPVFKFLKDYFIYAGFLDGYYGFLVCQLSASATFIKYIKLKQMWKEKPL